MNFRSLVLIHNEGLSRGKITIGTFLTRTYRVQQQTALSSVVAPPRKWSYAKLIVAAIFLYYLLRMVIDAWLPRPLRAVPGGETLMQVLFYGLVLGVAAATFLYNNWYYKEKLRNWQKKFICRQCGTIFSM